MSNRKTIYENSKLNDKELVKYLLNDLLDEIDYLSPHDQKDKVTTISHEIDNQIRKENNIKKIMELSRDIEQFFKQGGDYNSLECRIKHAPIIEDCDSIMNIYDVYLENVYKFILFEAFICRDTLLENEEIKEMVNNKIKSFINDNEISYYFMGSYASEKYRYLSLTIMEDIFLKSNIMSKELRDKLFIEEYKTASNNHNKSIETIKNKKKKLLKLRIILGAFVLGGAVSLGTIGVSTTRLLTGTDRITHEEGSWSEADKAYVGAILLLAFILCSSFSSFLLSELKEELELDEEHYKKLCTLLDDLQVTSNKFIDVDKLEKVMNEHLNDEQKIFIDDKGRIVLPGGVRQVITLRNHKEMGIPIPDCRVDLVKEEETMKNLKIIKK